MFHWCRVFGGGSFYREKEELRQVSSVCSLSFFRNLLGVLSLGTELSAQGFLSPSALHPLPAVFHHHPPLLPSSPPPLLQLRPDAFCALLVCVGCAVGVGVCCLSWWRCLESSSPPCGCQRLKAEPTVPCCSFHVAGTPTRGGSHDLIGVGGGVLKEVIFYGTWLFP